MGRLIRFSGTAFVEGDLDNGQELHLAVVTDDGRQVADAFGKVTAVTFRPRKDAPEIIERIHSVRVS